ncbi:MAG: YbjP/YqhG family protein [Acidobacteriia bacterium]|nr:YbjP/YqhG family protein [Terriglobia bacterium]
MLRTAKTVWILIFLLAPCQPLRAQTGNAQPSEESCRDFVQQFYDWYVKVGMPPKSDPLDLTLKSHWLSPELARQLKVVKNAEAKDKVVWLDADPVLNSQAPADKYAAGRVTRSGDHYLVEVRPTDDTDNANIVPELAFQSGTWVLVNFHYPNFSESPRNENLLAMLKDILKQIHAEASKPATSEPKVSRQ